jgi:hypothetical protein
MRASTTTKSLFTFFSSFVSHIPILMSIFEALSLWFHTENLLRTLSLFILFHVNFASLH